MFCFKRPIFRSSTLAEEMSDDSDDEEESYFLTSYVLGNRNDDFHLNHMIPSTTNSNNKKNNDDSDTNKNTGSSDTSSQLTTTATTSSSNRANVVKNDSTITHSISSSIIDGYIPVISPTTTTTATNSSSTIRRSNSSNNSNSNNNNKNISVNIPTVAPAVTSSTHQTELKSPSSRLRRNGITIHFNSFRGGNTSSGLTTPTSATSTATAASMFTTTSDNQKTSVVPIATTNNNNSNGPVQKNPVIMTPVKTPPPIPSRQPPAPTNSATTIINNHNNISNNHHPPAAFLQTPQPKVRRRINVHKRCKSVDWDGTNNHSNINTGDNMSNRSTDVRGNNAQAQFNHYDLENGHVRAISSSDIARMRAQKQQLPPSAKSRRKASVPSITPPKSIKKLQASFSPPSVFEDLADEPDCRYLTGISPPGDRSLHKGSGDKIPDKPAPPTTMSYKRKFSELLRQSVVYQQAIEPLSKAPYQRIGGLRMQLDNSTHSGTKEKLRQISIFVPHKTQGVHRVKLLASQNSYLRSLVKEALQKYSSETKMQPVNNSPSGYALHAAEESGCIDYEYPKIDISLDTITLSKLPISRFVIAPIDNYMSLNRLFYDMTDVLQRNPLQDIRLRVCLSFEGVERVFWQVFAPDMLIRDIEKFVKKRFLPEVVKVDAPAPAEIAEPAAEQTRKHSNKKEKTQSDQYIVDIQLGDNAPSKCIITKTIGRRSVKELRPNVTVYATIHANDQSDPASVMSAKAIELAKQKKEKEMRFFIPRFLPIDYREYSVIKINKYGRRQERIFAIDDKKVYNKLPYNHAAFNFLGLPTKTRKPERPIETLLNVITNPAKPLSFVTVFEDETLYWEAGTVVEKNEIVNTLKNLIWNYDRKRKGDTNHDDSHETTNGTVSSQLGQSHQNAFLRVLRNVSPEAAGT